MNWAQLAYQYGVGGLFFFLTLYVCFGSGAADLTNPSDRRSFKYLLAGFGGYLLMHTLWILLAARV